MPPDRVATGIDSVDRLLGGGLETDGLTEIYGEGGSGKSLFCLHLASRTALRDRWVFYIDTEGVSLDRLEAISSAPIDRVLRRLLVSRPKNLEEQSAAVTTACQLARDRGRSVGMMILDSATFFYRLALSQSDEDEARQALCLELAELLAAARDVEIPVVFTNQVWRNLREGSLEPLGGSFVNHVAKTILRFDRLEGNRRRIVLVKHRSLPEASAEFRIRPDTLA